MQVCIRPALTEHIQTNVDRLPATSPAAVDAITTR
jgi:hypothetical protein